MTGRMAQKLGSGIPCASTAHWQQTSQASASAPLLFGGAAQLYNEPPNAHICFSFRKRVQQHVHMAGGEGHVYNHGQIAASSSKPHIFLCILSRHAGNTDPLQLRLEAAPTGQHIILNSLAAHWAAHHPLQPGSSPGSTSSCTAWRSVAQAGGRRRSVSFTAA